MRPRDKRGPLDGPQVDNDPLSMGAGEAGVWGLPSEGVGVLEVPAALPGGGFDYSNGIVYGDAGPDAANVYAPPEHPHLLPAATNEPRAFELPHEATHRRFEPPRLVSIAQAAAGFTLIAAPNQGLHYVKVIALYLTLDAAGTLKFVQGDDAGVRTADLTGAMNLGGASAPPLQLQPARIENPWLFGSPDLALGIFTVTGKANGWAMVCYSPYDS